MFFRLLLFFTGWLHEHRPSDHLKLFIGVLWDEKYMAVEIYRWSYSDGQNTRKSREKNGHLEVPLLNTQPRWSKFIKTLNINNIEQRFFFRFFAWWFPHIISLSTWDCQIFQRQLLLSPFIHAGCKLKKFYIH